MQADLSWCNLKAHRSFSTELSAACMLLFHFTTVGQRDERNKMSALESMPASEVAEQMLLPAGEPDFVRQ
jgi:hypothetical protein